MIEIENIAITGLEPAIRGMRNPMNSWEKSDTLFVDDEGDYYTLSGDAGTCLDYSPVGALIGPNDHDLMTRLANAGPVHGKFRRMIVVYLDITAPLYWWKEFDTYKVGTVANSCSTMHKIHAKEFVDEDFSIEHLFDTQTKNEDGSYNIDCELTFEEIFDMGYTGGFHLTPYGAFAVQLAMLNKARDLYIKTKDKRYWWQMIQLLPSSYNQKRTVMLNYEVLANIYRHRKDHKLDEWREFCEWIESLPYSEIITGKEAI